MTRVACCMTICVISLVLIATSVSAAEEAGEEKVSVCLSCHRDLGGKMAEPVTLWEKSIHHRMGNNCEGCHGGDPNDAATAMSPEKGFVGAPKPEGVPEFCGKCHVGVKENYLKSPHFAGSQEGRGPNCVTCHHSHDVQKASFDLINESLCATCHSYENGQKIKKAFVSAELALEAMKQKLSYLDRRGMPVKRLEEKFFALRNSLHQMTHTLDLPEIQGKTDGVLKALEEMKGEGEGYRRRIHRRWWIGVGVALFLIVLITLLIRFHRTFEEEG